MTLPQLYRDSLSLLTDLYQLTMAFGYWKTGVAEREAVFHLTFRLHPFGGRFAVACGLSYVVDLLQGFFPPSRDDVRYLRSLIGSDERPLFEESFLEFLQSQTFRCDIDAVEEGTIVFAHEPLVRVRGPIWQAQIVETALLTIINFQTLVASKAARICHATRGEPVLEFGLRRAHGIDGGLAASRAAFVGGCAATSNVLAGKLFDIPVKGTHAHSWVMSFDDELESFTAYADAMPNNCVFLVDTYDTLAGVRNAIRAGKQLRERGQKMVGVRLDSGDLADLSIRTRKLLDEAGFTDAAIVASNDLDEYQIEQLKQQGAAINIWGVGTRLATAYDQPALGGVYKLGALRNHDGNWQYKIKLSEQIIKTSNPGIHQIRRFYNSARFVGDVIYDEPTGIDDRGTANDMATGSEFVVEAGGQYEDLLVPVFREGRLVYTPPSPQAARSRTLSQLSMLDESIRRPTKGRVYPVGLERRLFQRKQEMIAAAQVDS